MKNALKHVHIHSKKEKRENNENKKVSKIFQCPTRMIIYGYAEENEIYF